MVSIRRRSTFQIDQSAWDALAKGLAPPSGTDAYGYARTKEIANKTEALKRVIEGDRSLGTLLAAGVPAGDYARLDAYNRSLTPGARPQDFDASMYTINGNAGQTFEGQRRALEAEAQRTALSERNKIVAADLQAIPKDAVRNYSPASMDALGYGKPQAASPKQSPTRPAANSNAPLFDPMTGAVNSGANTPAAMPSDRSGAGPMFNQNTGDVFSTGSDLPSMALAPSALSLDAFGMNDASGGSAPTGPAPLPPIGGRPSASPGTTPLSSTSITPTSPEPPMRQYGVMDVEQGRSLVLPDGRVINNPKPLSMDQFRAQQAQDMRSKGALSDAELKATIFGNDTPLETVNTPNGPQFAYRSQAVGQPAFIASQSQPTQLNKLISERDALPPNDPRRQSYQAAIEAQGRGQQQSAYDRQSDESLAKLGDDIFTAAKSSLTDRATYDTILSAVDNPNVNQGALGASTLALKKTLNSFGFDAGNTGPAEMMQALGNQIALRLRDPSQGAGMPGALSDSDRKFLSSMSVSLGNSPQANRLLAQYYLAAQTRNVDLEDLRQQYVAQHGRIEEGFRPIVIDYLRNNDPTSAVRNQVAGGNSAPAKSAQSTPAPAQSAPSANLTPGTIDNGYRFRGGDPGDEANWEQVR